ncbi:hypothetical protein TcBrA4_0114800 [Trypanosoma cruzi]|nr:hypothetical protein TcBrA4_0114800 [Trypanosoma cruzi]
MLCVASDDGGMKNRPVEFVVNFGFPRALMAPGKEESLLECLVIRTRTLLHHTAARDTVDEKDDESFFFEGRDAPGREDAADRVDTFDGAPNSWTVWEASDVTCPGDVVHVRCSGCATTRATRHTHRERENCIHATK